MRKKRRSNARGDPSIIYEGSPIICPKCNGIKFDLTDISSDLKADYHYTFIYTCKGCKNKITFLTNMRKEKIESN